MSTFTERVLDAVRVAVDRYGSARALSQATGVGAPNISRWLSGKQVPRLSEVAPILEAIGANLILPSTNSSRGGDTVNAAVLHPIVENPVDLAEYVAAPLVGEVGAGPGRVPEDTIISWVLLDGRMPSVRGRGNLLAVEISPSSTSMLPTLAPKDMVIVDRDDRDVGRGGHIMLVRDPDGNGMIKRVSTEPRGRGDWRVTFYSDNSSQYPPMVFSLREDYCGDWERVVVGRVIWAWSDVRNK